MSILRPEILAAAFLGLSTCGPAPIDPHRQIGANPYLPPIHQYLLPIRIAFIVGIPQPHDGPDSRESRAKSHQPCA
jgi:hypothetical protein